MIFVGSLSALIGNIIAKPVLTFVGEMNMIYFGIIVECSRLIIWSFVKYVLLQIYKEHATFAASLQI